MERYCEQHKQSVNQYYDKRIRDKQTIAFYHSLQWQRVREQALIRDNYLCQRCLSDKRLTPAEMVHHKIEVKQDWSKRLMMDNLESLCQACHNKMHGGKINV